MPALVTTKVDANGDVVTISRTLSAEAGVVTTNAISGGVWTKTYFEYDTAMVGWKVVETRNTQNTLPYFSVEIPNRTQIFPLEFRPLIKTTTTKNVLIGTATQPALVSGQLFVSRAQRDVYTYEETTEAIDTLPGAVSIAREETNPEKQVVSIVDTLRVTGTSTAVPSATQDVAVRDLGVGYEIETISTVPDVFNKGSYTKSVVDLIPPELKAAIPIFDKDETIPGIASTDPILLTGELSRNEEQVTKFTKRVRTRSTGGPSLPVSITASETNAAKQIVSIIYKLETAGTNTIVPTSLIDVSVRNLGDGLEVVTTKTIPSLFAGNTYAISVENLIPPSFKAAIPTVEGEIIEPGLANSTPVLIGDEIARAEHQLTLYTKSVKTTSFGGVTLPITLTGGRRIVEKFGIQLVGVEVVTLAPAHTSTIPVGQQVIEAAITELSASMELASSLVAENNTWPVLHSLLYDEEMKVLYPEDRQIVDPTFPIVVADPTATSLVELKAIDPWHSWKITTHKFPTANSRDNANVSDIMRPYTFPGRFDINVARRSGGVAAARTPHSTLVRMTQRQWWIISPTKPILTFDEIITQTALWWDISTQPRPDAYENVICDSYNVLLYGTYIVIPASIPSLTEFLGSGSFLPASVTWTLGSSLVQGKNTDFINTFGMLLRLNPLTLLNAPDGSSWRFSVSSATAMVLLASSVANVNPGFFLDQTYSIPPYRGPTVTIPFASTIPAPAGTTPTGWVGTPRVIAATVEPDKLPNLWRITTHEVVMR